jgi:hypothetical protein
MGYQFEQRITGFKKYSLPMRQFPRTGAFLLSLSATLFGAFALELLTSHTPVSVDLHAAQQASDHLSELKHLIESEIGQPYAKESSQCRLIGFGSKPCGGPRTYLIYSRMKTDESRLEQLVTEYNRLERRHNIEQKMFSDCMLARKPKIEIRNGVCIAVDELKEKWELWRQQKWNAR